MSSCKWRQIPYRVWQVWAGLRPRLSPADLEEVARWLSPQAFDLWQRQDIRDRAHALRVMRKLQQEGVEDRVLMQAALLHDVGKVVAPLRLWHRVVWVLAEWVPWVRAWLVHPHGWRRPFWVLAEHPRLGAELAQKAGCDPQVVWLIAHHQDPIPPQGDEQAKRLQRLRRADEQS